VEFVGDNGFVVDNVYQERSGMAGRTEVYKSKLRLRWQHHIRQWLMSDKLIVDYCREHNIHAGSFYKYKDRLGEEVLAEMMAEQGNDLSGLTLSGAGPARLIKKVRSKSSGRSPFVELKVRPDEESSACIRVELPGGAKMEFPAGIGPEQVGRIICACGGNK